MSKIINVKSYFVLPVCGDANINLNNYFYKLNIS